MEEIVPAVDKKLLKSELTKSKFIRYTNYENNEIYIFKSHECPNVMKEVGRLREIAYRDAGGGTGYSLDIDTYDTLPNPYKQIIVWNPNEEEIVGGYRYFKLKEANKIDNDRFQIATNETFHFSSKFIKEFLPYAIELGKSFIQPKFQPSTDERKGLFSLDNLWDGLGVIIYENPDIKYFFGRVTLYLNYDETARDILLYFLDKYFGDKENLVYPYEPREIKTDTSELEKIFSGGNFEEDFVNLNNAVRNRNENIPPLIKSYMSLSPSMKTFGVAQNKKSFKGQMEGIGMIIKIDDVYPSKKKRHINSYVKQKEKN